MAYPANNKAKIPGIILIDQETIFNKETNILEEKKAIINVKINDIQAGYLQSLRASTNV